MADLDFSVTATPKELAIACGTSYFWYRGYVHRGVARLTDRNSGAGVHWNRISGVARQRLVDPAGKKRTQT